MEICDDKTSETTTAEESIVHRPRCARMFKMALPHVGLYLFLFVYLICGAAMFRRIEYDADLKLQKEKFNNLRDRYRDVKDEVDRMSVHLSFEKREQLQEKLHEMLVDISRKHEGPNFKMDRNLQNEDVMPPRWDKMSSVLYALSILTTTGYSYAVPASGFGQCMAVVYGLIGIPLMVLAAVDIGRFLTHIVLKVYTRYCEFSKRIFGSKKKEIMDMVNKQTVMRVTKHRSFRREKSKKKTGMGMLDDKERQNDETNVDRECDGEEVVEGETKRLPLSLNASILLIFCMLGGLMYLAAGSNKTFLEAFFVTFNLVANLTMGEMPTDLNHVLTLIYIFIFVTFGVGVLSMCAELAALELKELFLKIHYFGRKINFKRRKRSQEQIDVEVKELLKIIEEIRKKYPEKEHITSVDILQYMHEKQMAALVAAAERRDTIAFMPQTVETLKFADEGDQEEREVGRVDELPIDKTVEVWAFVTEAELEEKLKQASGQNQRRILGRLQRHKRQSMLNSIHYPQDECVNLLCAENEKQS